MATLVTTAVIRAHDQLSQPLAAMASKVAATGTRMQAQMHRMSAGIPAVAAAGMTLGLNQLIQTTKESAQLAWDAQSAFMGSAMDDKSLPNLDDKYAASVRQSEEMRAEAMRLSKVFGLMPELFQKAGAEAARMGLGFEKSKSMMTATALLKMADHEADPATMAKALGTYGIIYGAEKDPAEYAKQLNKRAAQLALAGALTRTSASKIEEGMRNLMGAHGAFGGSFEDAVAIVATGSQLGQMEKETGTAFKSLITRFLALPQAGRAALASANIDISKFMDFGAIDPTRATNQLVGLFKGQLGKKAGGTLYKFLEDAQRTGRAKSPDFVNDVMAVLEQNGLRFAGVEDRNYAARKVAAVMHGAGGKFDPIGLIDEVTKAISEGRAGADIWAKLGEPKRLHQYASFNTAIKDLKALRDLLKDDPERYMEMVQKGFAVSDIGKISRMESAMRRFQLSLVRTEAIQNFVSLLGDLGEKLASLPGGVQNMLGLGAVAAAVSGPLLLAGAALKGMGQAMFAVAAAGGLALLSVGRIALAVGALAAAPLLAVASNFRYLAVGMAMLGSGVAASAVSGIASLATGLGVIVGGGVAIAAGVALAGLAAAAVTLGAALYNLDWGKIGNSEEATRLSASWDALKASLGNLGDAVNSAAASFLKLFGINVEGSVLGAGVTWLIGKLSAAVEWLAKFINMLSGKGFQLLPSKELEPGQNGPAAPKTFAPTQGPNASTSPQAPNWGQVMPGSVTVGNLSEDGIAAKTSNPIVAAINGLHGVIASLKGSIGVTGTPGAANAPTPAGVNGSQTRGK